MKESRRSWSVHERLSLTMAGFAVHHFRIISLRRWHVSAGNTPANLSMWNCYGQPPELLSSLLTGTCIPSREISYLVIGGPRNEHGLDLLHIWVDSVTIFGHKLLYQKM